MSEPYPGTAAYWEAKYDGIAADLARCRAANVYDAEAHRKAAEFEVLLRRARPFCNEQGVGGIGWDIDHALPQLETPTWDCICGSTGHKRGAQCLCGGMYENSALETAIQSCPICSAIGGHLVSCERWELLGSTAETKGDASGN